MQSAIDCRDYKTSSKKKKLPQKKKAKIHNNYITYNPLLGCVTHSVCWVNFFKLPNEPLIDTHTVSGCEK